MVNIMLCFFISLAYIASSHGSQTEYIVLSKSMVSSESTRKTAAKMISMNSTFIKGLSLGKNAISSSDFIKFTNLLTLLPADFPRLVLVDLSDNNLDTDCAQALLHWLYLPTVLYVNITGNTKISLKKIQQLHGTLMAPLWPSAR